MMAMSTKSHVSSTLFIRNLPYSARKEDLESLFEDFGPLKQCFVVTEKGVKDKCRGFGYVTFALRDDAEKAVKCTQKLEGRALKLDFANRKPKRGPEEAEKSVKKESTDQHESDTAVTAPEAQNAKKRPNKSQPEEQVPPQPDRKKRKKEKKERQKEKEMKEAEREKRKCRLIVRNLPFKCSEDELKSTFEAFGTISEVSIPVNAKTSKKLGFGFIQFETLKAAAKAVKHINGKEIKGRIVAVDWTLPRTEYLEAVKKAAPLATKDESKGRKNLDEDEMDSDNDDDLDDNDDVKGSEEDNDIDEEEEGEENEDIDDDDDDDDDEDEEAMDKSTSKQVKKSRLDDEGEDDRDDDDEDDDDDDEDTEEDSEVEEELEEEEEDDEDDHQAIDVKKRPDDVHEGRTLFIRNVPFDSLDDDVREIFAPFGEIEMCRIVVDPMTEHSRGTAFVKFKQKEDAEKCLHESDNLRLSGRLLNVSVAISRSEAVKLRTAEKEKAKEEHKDKRNLHLLREGLIRPGTKAAEGLSEQYLNKRQKVENLKKEKLKNLNVFVSPTRLAIHNLPRAVDDKRLREIAKEGAGDKNAKVIEAKIMRDLSQPNSQGKFRSLGFGFVEFTQHEHALKALLHINNNPELFGPQKRPIVGFSLENKKALEIKEKRREKARMKHVMYNREDEQKAKEPKQRKPYSQQRLQQTKQLQQHHQKKTGTGSQLHGENTMVMPQDGKKKGLPRHFGAKNRWRDRGKVADEKRQRRKEKRMVLQRQVWNSMKDPKSATDMGISKKELRKEKQKKRKQKQGHTQLEEKQFNALVSKYKQKITRTSSGEKKVSSKWFDT